MEAWIHHDRVIKAAKSVGLGETFSFNYRLDLDSNHFVEISYVQPIEGRIGKPQPLFAVYVMKNCVGDVMKVLPHIAVRDEDGKWTDDYCKILEYMAIPTI